MKIDVNYYKTDNLPVT